jgi:ABC-type Fe3+/spermidine/putrescine transport system ATPase subunit
MVFQSYALFPHMTVSANVAYGLRMLKVPRAEIGARVAEALEMIGIPDKADAKPEELSGGQQQRVALARALVTRPAVLLLDEPLGALDLKMRRRMQAELKELQRSVGITFVYVTHDQEEALALSDEIVVMQDGLIAQKGTPEEIYRRPVSAYVADFIGETNLIRNGRAGQMVAVRPENVSLGAADGTGLVARVSDIRFMGPFHRVYLRTAEGESVRADIRADPPPVGAEVRVVWDEGEAVRLAD